MALDNQYLHKVNSPNDLKQLSQEELVAYCREVRDMIVDELSRNPGHLASSLGTVELTTALHYVFSAPQDKIVWDVGHQAYTHKIITGRRDEFHTLRKKGGIAGFPRPEESEYDAFVGGHSSVSISAALGMAQAAKLQGKEQKTVAVIGDGALTGGLAFEGLNNAGASEADLLVVLNDNNMSISSNVGALKENLLKIASSKRYNRFKNGLWNALSHTPRLRRGLQKMGHGLKSSLLSRSNLFEGLNFRYFGPVDGHDLKALIRTFNDLKEIPGPKLLHVITVKGKGYAPAEGSTDPVWHAPGRFDPATGKREKGKEGLPPRYQDVFGKALLELAQMDERVVGITPAMLKGCSMDILQRAMPERCFDVGICEGHAVTFSAGLAAEGLVPFCNIYSSFLQRGYDNVIHDVALSGYSVVLCLDRAGVVGEDGSTHNGAFDIAFLRPVPGMRIATPSNEQELRDMMYTALQVGGPFAIRYPRGNGEGVAEEPMKMLEVGRARKVREGQDVALLCFGTVTADGIAAAEIAEREGVSVEVVDMRWAKPIDEQMVAEVAAKFRRVVTVEDGVVDGGAGSAVATMLAQMGYDGVVECLGIKDKFVQHASVAEQKAECEYDVDGIVKALLREKK